MEKLQVNRRVGLGSQGSGENFGSKLQRVMLFTGATEKYSAARALYKKRGFYVIATIPRGTLDNPYSDELLYVLQIST